MLSAGSAPKSWTFFWWQEEQNQRPLQEKANRRSSSRYLPQQICCSECGAIHSHKGKHQIVLRALFGKLRLDSLRLYHCGRCSKEERRSFSPLAELLPERTAPELPYLESKIAAMTSYGLTARLLAEVLPTGGDINIAGVYRKLKQTTKQMEAELGEEKW